MTPESYLAEVKARLATSPVVSKVIDVVEDWSLSDRGYFRARLTLSNGDFLEVAEYFVIEDGRSVTQRYRHQWMTEDRQLLRKRWDNVEHFPDLQNFPHHIHVGDKPPISGRSMSILEVLEQLEIDLSV
jgi:hypothetical protein